MPRTGEPLGGTPTRGSPQAPLLKLCADPCRRCGTHLPAGGADLRVCSGCRRALFRTFDLRGGDPVTTVDAGHPAPPRRFVGFDVKAGQTVAALRAPDGGLLFVPVESVWRVVGHDLVRPCTGERMHVGDGPRAFAASAGGA